MNIGKILRLFLLICCSLIYCYDAKAQGAIVRENNTSTISSKKSKQKTYPDTPKGWYDKATDLSMKFEYEKTIPYYVKAAEQGYNEAYYDLFFHYVNGYGVDKSFQGAISWLKQGDSLNDNKCTMELAFIYWKGRYGERADYKLAKEFLEKATSNGVPTGSYFQAEFYSDNKNPYKDYKKAFELYSSLADEEDSSAQYPLGYFYLNGIGTNKNREKAKYWLLRAAK